MSAKDKHHDFTMARSVEQYRQIAQQLLIDYSQIPYVHDDLKDETIFDQAADRYLLLTVGWQGRKRVNTIVLHLDIRDGQIWIQCNNTDQNIVEELIERGVDANDIIFPTPSITDAPINRAELIAA